MIESYPVPIKTQRFELVIKRSRFVTTVSIVEDRESARNTLQGLRVEFPDANHHCWAMVAGRPDDVYQQDQSDDGEPRGTAGKPMLNVLLHSGLGNTLVVVTRYFGGVKLGAGGLVRAYTESVSTALGGLSTRLTTIKTTVEILCTYTLVDTLGHRLINTDIAISEREFSDIVRLKLQVPASKVLGLEEQLAEMGSGSIVLVGRDNGKVEDQ